MKPTTVQKTLAVVEARFSGAYNFYLGRQPAFSFKPQGDAARAQKTADNRQRKYSDGNGLSSEGARRMRESGGERKI